MNTKVMAGVFLGAILSGTATASTPVSGSKREPYVVFYGGASHNNSGTLSGTATDYEYTGLIFIVPVFREVGTYEVQNTYDSSDSFLVGGRGGIWFLDKSKGWGLAGDLTYFKIDSGPDETTLTVVPLSIVMLYRFPLMVSEDFPNGRLQPHVGAGVAVVFGNISTRIIDARGIPVQEKQEAAGPGGSLHAGFTWKLTENKGLFFEYRYLHARMEGLSEETRDEVYVTEVDLETSAIAAHQLLAGFSVSF